MFFYAPLSRPDFGATLQYARLDDKAGSIAGEDESSVDITAIRAFGRVAKIPIPEDHADSTRRHNAVAARPGAVPARLKGPEPSRRSRSIGRACPAVQPGTPSAASLKLKPMVRQW